MKAKINKRIKRIAGLMLFVAASPVLLRAQVSFQFMPALNGQSVNGLFSVQLQNNSTAIYNGKIKIVVRDGAGKTVIMALTPPAITRPGLNTIAALAPQSRIQFGNGDAALVLAQTGRFPEGEYEYCFEFSGAENKAGAGGQSFENCFSFTIAPMIPLTLVYPGDGDEICNLRPALNWQPGMPLNNNLQYRLMLSEKKDHQLAADALVNNVPVLQQDNIPGFMLIYPSQAPSLQKDKNYVWQVVAYLGNTKLTQSEIWSFSTKCDDKKPGSARDSYRELSTALNGNFYMAGNALRVTLSNPYKNEAMDYSITDLANPVKKIGNLPAIKVQTGLNKIDIILDDVSGLETGKMYLFKVRNIGNQPLYLRFIYKPDAEL